MKISTLVIGVLWLYMVVGAIQGGYTLPRSQHAQDMSATDNWTAASMFGLPLLLILLSFRTIYAPGVWTWLSSFMIRLKIELLFASGSLLYGTVGLLRTVQLGGPRGAFVVGGFFVSGGIGFLISYFVLRSRGLLRLNPR